MFGKLQVFTGQLQMASLSLCPHFETNLMSNRNVIELLSQLKSAKAHGKHYIKVRPPLVRHLKRNHLLKTCIHFYLEEQGFGQLLCLTSQTNV